MFKSVLEGQRVVELGKRKIFPHCVLLIRNILPLSMPAYFVLTDFFFRVYRNFHTIVEHSVALIVVHDVELDFVACFCVLNSEEKPLGMTFTVYIVLHQQIVFAI